MTKPLDNEPTTETDARAMDGQYCSDMGSKITLQSWDYSKDKDGEVVPVDFASNLERRLRHAEELLKRFRRGETSISAIETLHNDNIAHLEAAGGRIGD